MSILDAETRFAAELMELDERLTEALYRARELRWHDSEDLRRRSCYIWLERITRAHLSPSAHYCAILNTAHEQDNGRRVGPHGFTIGWRNSPDA